MPKVVRAVGGEATGLQQPDDQPERAVDEHPAQLAALPGRLGLRVRVRQHDHVPFRRVGHLPVPELHMAYRFRTSPYLDAARRNVVEWGRRVGFLDPVPGMWDERRMRGIDLPHCGSMIDPDATPEGLDLTSQWLAWGTYGDD